METVAASLSQPSLHLPALLQGIEALSPSHSSAAPVRRELAMPSGLSVAIVDDRALMRDCFGKGLKAAAPAMEIEYFSDMTALLDADQAAVERIQVVLFCAEWLKTRAAVHIAHIAQMTARNPSLNIVILSDIEDSGDILKVMESGARGVIPTEVTIEVAVKAMELVAAGGIYVPPSLLHWCGRVIHNASLQPPQPSPVESAFTSRQLSVVEALRRGKANKIIAYELNMCESTVKVHIHNIMKKLKAKNRTEVAYILNNEMHRDSTTPRT